MDQGEGLEVEERFTEDQMQAIREEDESGLKSCYEPEREKEMLTSASGGLTGSIPNAALVGSLSRTIVDAKE